MHGRKDVEQEEHNNNNNSIRKGPWKREEDEVLLHHVKKYGPRDWSSIRSKGLLQRTGKSCRLRWVNKLRPNLKNGCKFSLEEERVVIDLQAQFGNRWAKIASYLSGRTDNDVKNFWSSRKKRMARMHKTTTSKTTTSSKSNKNKAKLIPTTFHEAPTNLSVSSEGETSSKPPPQLCSSRLFMENTEVIKMVPLPDLIKSEKPSSETSHVGQDIAPSESCKSTTEQIPFPQISELQTDLIYSMGNQVIFEPNLFDMFGPLDSSEFGMVPFPQPLPFFEPSSSKNIDSFFDDLPVDMFDQIMEEPPPTSPSNF